MKTLTTVNQVLTAIQENFFFKGFISEHECFIDWVPMSENSENDIDIYNLIYFKNGSRITGREIKSKAKLIEYLNFLTA